MATDTPRDPEPDRASRRGRMAVTAVIALAALGAAFGAGWLLGDSGDADPDGPAISSLADAIEATAAGDLPAGDAPEGSTTSAAPGPGAERLRLGLQGSIVGVTEDSLTVVTRAGEVTVGLTADTRVATPATVDASALQEGEQVLVFPQPRALGGDGSTAAVVIVVP